VADHSKFHSWFNTALAILALIGTGVIAYNGRNLYSLNLEAIGFTPRFTYDCGISVGMTMAPGQDKPQHHVGLCWDVIVANQSNSRISFISYRAFESPSDGKAPAGIPVDILDRDGRRLSFPVALDAGEARHFLFRLSMPATDAIEDVIPASTGTTLHSFALAAAEKN
jgi:hypothetical protein